MNYHNALPTFGRLMLLPQSLPRSLRTGFFILTDTMAWLDGDGFSQSKEALPPWLVYYHGKQGQLRCWQYFILIRNFWRLYLPPSPTQTKRHGIKGLLRPKQGWFSEREEIIMVTRVLRDDPAKATMHNVSLSTITVPRVILTTFLTLAARS